MVLVNFPLWIHKANGISDLISAAVALLIAYYANKIYNYSSDNRYRRMSIAFILIAASFIAKITVNALIYYEVLKTIWFWKFGLLADMIVYFMHTNYWAYVLLLCGLILFAAIALKIKDRRVIYLLFCFTLVSALFVAQQYFMTNILGAIILFFVFPVFYSNYKKRKSKSSFLVFLFFFLMFISRILFVFVAVNNYLYVAGQLVQLVSFLILLINYLLVMR